MMLYSYTKKYLEVRTRKSHCVITRKTPKTSSSVFSISVRKYSSLELIELNDKMIKNYTSSHNGVLSNILTKTWETKVSNDRV